MSLAELRSHIPLVNIPKKKKPKKAIRKVSKKRKPVNAEYMRLRAEFLEKHQYCWFWLLENGFSEAEVIHVTGRGGVVGRKDGFVAREFTVPLATEIHHRKGRGKYLLDTSTWMAVSSDGHKAIHNDPKKSYELGYMLPRR